MTELSYEEISSKAALLKKQCKKHQLFKETLLEAVKLSEAGFLHLKAAALLPEEDRAADLKEAATCLSRAKRLSRGLVKESRDEEH